MTGQLEKLNDNIEKLIKIFEAYPNPIDEASQNSAESYVNEHNDKAEEKPKAAPQEEAAAATHTVDELAALGRKVIQVDKATNSPKVKEKLKDLGIAKLTMIEDEDIDEMYDFLKGLE